MHMLSPQLPQRRSWRWSIAALLAIVVLWSADTASPARSAGRSAHAASREVATLAAHDAAYLAGRIRAAASRPGSQTIVKVLHGCCGVVALEVYERSRPGRTARFGVYGLSLVTSPHMIDQIKVFEDKTHGPYHLGEAIASELYSFELSPDGNARPHEGNWGIGVSHPFHADDHWITGKVAYHYEEAELTAAELQVLDGQALSVLNKAESHTPVSQEAVLAPGLPCGLPENQACEPGGRW
jgi:hypothetical protein